MTGSQVTSILFREDIRALDEALAPYLEQKEVTQHFTSLPRVSTIMPR
jgi:hypothetical protein